MSAIRSLAKFLFLGRESKARTILSGLGSVCQICVSPADNLRNDPAAIEIVVRAEAIDDLVKAGALQYPRFVRIDVEGAEGRVRKGMRDTIAASRPILFVKCSDSGRETAGSILRELGCRCQSAVTREW
jgi:hypothetical protein